MPVAEVLLGPGRLDVPQWYPWDSWTLELTWPTGLLAGRTFTAHLGDTPLTVGIVGDVMSITSPAFDPDDLEAPVEAMPWVLDETGGRATIVGTWVPNTSGIVSPQVGAVAIPLTPQVTVLVSVVGGSGGGGGGGTVDSVVAGTAVTVNTSDPANPVVGVQLGSSAGTAAEGNDSRLSNSRTPTAHAASHTFGGTDAVTLTQAQITGLVAALAAKADAANAALTGNPTAPTATPGDNDTSIATTAFVQAAVAAGVVGLLDYRGTYNASGNTFPASGGSGSAGALLKGDFWVVSTPGTLGGTAVTNGDLVIALTDAPAQTAANWDLVSHELGYAPENVANKSTDGALTANSTTLYPSQSAVKTYADGKVAQTITDGVTTSAPSQDAVRDALVLKADAASLGTAAALNTGTTSGTIPVLGAGGVLAIGRLATGTPTGSKFVRDDGTLATPAGGGGSTVLVTPTEYTASFTLAANELAKLNTTSGTPIVATLPTTPADGTVCIVKWTSGPNATAQFACGGSAKFNTSSGSTTATLSLLNLAYSARYQATGDLWILETNPSLGGLDTRYRSQLWELFIRKTADETVSNSTVQQNDDHLFSSIAASEVWVYRFVLFATGALSTNKLDMAITAPAGATLIYNGIGPRTGAADALTQIGATQSTSGGEVQQGMGPNGAQVMQTLEVLVLNGATPGTVQLQWAQNNASANNTTVLTNSYLIARRFA